MLNKAEQSIAAEGMTCEMDACFAAAAGLLMMLRMDNYPEFISQALQSFCEGRVFSGDTAEQPLHRVNRLRREFLNRNHWTILLGARVVIKYERNTGLVNSGLGYLTPIECAAQCGHRHHPVAWRSTEIGINHNLALDPGGPTIRKLPMLAETLDCEAVERELLCGPSIVDASPIA